MAGRSFPLNLGFFAGAGALKIAVRGFAPGPFSTIEMKMTQSLLEEAMQAGALGLSFGVMYRPECYSTAREMADLARVAAKYGGVLTAHIRGEGDSLVPSVSEMIEVAEMAGMPLNISHFKATGIQNWRSTIFRAIDVIEKARVRGVPVTADFYPYDGGSTTILSLLPPSVLENTQAELAAKLSTKQGVDFLRQEVGKRHERWDNMALSIGWDRIIISSPVRAENEDCRGKSMKAAAESRELADETELLARLICEEDGRTGIIVLSMAWEDIDTVAALPWTCLISDSLYSGGSSPHPRLNGSFPKALRVFVREKKLLSMETAIAKMTGMPAARAGIKNRGLLKEGNAADVLVFDPEQFTDHADYTNPTERATGMGQVIVNGKLVSSDGRQNGVFITRDSAPC
jgi:N-acyl-D-aspartate/D-glutamate deacylase